MLKQLYEKLKLGSEMSPLHDGWKFITLECCCCAFEPDGRASENWEEYWLLTLPHIRAYAKYPDGWRLMQFEVPMGFKARTAEEAIQKAIQFLDECPNPLKMTPEQYNAMRN